MNTRKFLILPTIILSMLMLSACSSDKKPPKESDGSGDKINVQIIVSPESNPDDAGRPSPIRLDLYQLATDSEFKQFNYLELTEQAKEKIGDKLIQHDQYIFYPDTVKVLPVKVDSHLKYLGVVAGYRNLDNSQWRLILLKQKKRWYQFGKQYLYLSVDKSTLSQISKSDMKEKLRNYKERHPEDKNITFGGRAKGEKNDLSKGIFRETVKNDYEAVK